jgi:hypothetical protein
MVFYFCSQLVITEHSSTTDNHSVSQFTEFPQQQVRALITSFLYNSQSIHIAFTDDSYPLPHNFNHLYYQISKV